MVIGLVTSAMVFAMIKNLNDIRFKLINQSCYFLVFSCSWLDGGLRQDDRPTELILEVSVWNYV